MVTKKEASPCPVCGKLIHKQGAAGHNKSKYHLDALAKQNVQGPINEPVHEPNKTGIQTTVPEGQNDKNKDTRGQEGQHTEDNDKWDGYLC